MNLSNAYSLSASSMWLGLSSRRDSASPAADGERVVPAIVSAQSVDTNPAASVGREKGASPLSPAEAPSAGARGGRQKAQVNAEKAAENRRLAQEDQLIQNQVKTLAARDREVRAHEQAHMAAGGQYAGAATYQYQRGPNGVNYAVGGEVPISTSKEATPEATLRKAQIIHRAALAPAEPSSQDRKVAAMATQMESAARAEMVREQKRQTEHAEATSADAENQNKDVRAGEPEKVSGMRPLSDMPVDRDVGRERLQRRISSLDGSDNHPPGTLLSLMA